MKSGRFYEPKERRTIDRYERASKQVGRQVADLMEWLYRKWPAGVGTRRTGEVYKIQSYERRRSTRFLVFARAFSMAVSPVRELIIWMLIVSNFYGKHISRGVYVSPFSYYTTCMLHETSSIS